MKNPGVVFPRSSGRLHGGLRQETSHVIYKPSHTHSPRGSVKREGFLFFFGFVVFFSPQSSRLSAFPASSQQRDEKDTKCCAVANQWSGVTRARVSESLLPRALFGAQSAADTLRYSHRSCRKFIFAVQRCHLKACGVKWSRRGTCVTGYIHRMQ